MIKHEGISKRRLSREPLEAIYARRWEEINRIRVGQPRGALQFLLSATNEPCVITAKEATIAATVVQWLGSPVGQCFVDECLAEQRSVENQKKGKEMKITTTMLAKDILKWLKPGAKVKIKPRIAGTYVAGPKGDKDELDLQKILKSGKVCTVCALGGFIAAVAYRRDEIKLSHHEHHKMPGCATFSASERGALAGFFSGEQCAAIEGAFEHGYRLPPRIVTAKGRLRFICQNIVDNRGTFVPLPPA